MKLWESSSKRLYDKRVHPDMQRLFDAVISDWPFPIWDMQIGRDGAYRSQGRQGQLFHSKPKRSWTLKSKHIEGKAIDITLYWKGTEKAIWGRYEYTAVFGYIYFIAESLGVKIRWGADWNRNWIIKEEGNHETDFVHYELSD